MKKYYIGLLSLSLFAACSRETFSNDNTNPDNVLTIDPATEFTTGALIAHNNDFEAYYDYNRNINFWTQAWVPTGGNSVSFMLNLITASNQSYRNGSFYSRDNSGVGVAMTDIQHLIDNMPVGKKEKYVQMRAIAGIMLAYYGWYVSDIQGSIAYTQAFKARYTIPALLTPKYDTQEALYDTLNTQLKNIAAILETSQPVAQAMLGSNDIYFHGVGNEATNWAKAANSLRLKIAMRLLKRNPTLATSIITEVLGDNTGVINSRTEQWVFKAGAGFSSGGNWSPSAASGEKNIVDFMFTKQDPRIRNIYQVSPLTQDMFDSAKAQGVIPATETWQPYRGIYASPDASKQTGKSFYFGQITYSYLGATTNTNYASTIQNGLFDASYQNMNGNINFPVITYADVCFMRAELAAKGITSENAQTWYYNGIDASLADYDQWGNDAKVIGYTSLSAAEDAQYKTETGIQYDPANALEQIYLQAYINFYKNQNEEWALMKRTGYPSATGNIFTAEIITSNGTVQPMPRRWPLYLPLVSDMNYDNKLQAIQDMQKDPTLGDLSDITGRVWWDMP